MKLIEQNRIEDAREACAAAKKYFSIFIKTLSHSRSFGLFTNKTKYEKIERNLTDRPTDHTKPQNNFE